MSAGEVKLLSRRLPVLVGVLCLFVSGASLRAAEETETELVEAIEAAPVAPSETTPGSATSSASPPVRREPVPVLQLGARLDTAFSTGGAVQQGFSIPSVRLSALGAASDTLSYRLSVGQAREFSSLLVPQLIPTEAFLVLGKSEHLVPGDLVWKFGMFTPALNPWWAPDLSDVSLPDYHEAHKRLFLGRDIGVQINYQFTESLAVFAGAFNGNGVYGLNTNNARAMAGGVEWSSFSNTERVRVGVSGYFATQSSVGSVNYRSDWAASLYAHLAFPHSVAEVGLDFVVGDFLSSVTNYRPTSLALFGALPIAEWVALFVRLETARQVPQSGLDLLHVQIGPQLLLSRFVKAYLLFDSLDVGTGTENAGLLRIRVSL